MPTGPAQATFADVAPGLWAYRHIEYTAAQRVSVGYRDGTYHPDWTANRGQMAAFLSRSMVETSQRPDLPNYTPPATPSFADVAQDFPFYKSIE